ncbi:putative WRKY transcription factor 12 [Hordeum vulgare]|nr:putative WRKY transcription factor 12 [Hordeum vulgare]
MALAHGQAASRGATTAGGAATAITFSFQQPSDPPLNGGLSHHHGLLGYSPLVLDHPTTTTSSSSTIPAAPSLHHLHAPAGAIHPPRSSEEADRERQRGKAAVTGMAVNSAPAGGSGGGGRSHGPAAAVAAGMGVGAVRMKKAAGGGAVKARRKVREPRFCFKTMSDVDVLDDGYKWRKYGQKVVKNTQHPRSYYRCTQDKCRVKKRVERLAEDPRMVITTYEGRHVHSPSRDDDDAARANAEMSFIW